MAELNLGLRFILELVGIGAAAYWGWNASQDGIVRVTLAIGAPAVLIAVWALLIAPGASGPIPVDTRPWVGSAVLLGAAGLLWLAGQPVPAMAFAVLIVVNQALMVVLGGER